MSGKNIEQEIHDTIVKLCQAIQEGVDSNYPPQELAELVKATAELIEACKGVVSY